MKETVYGKNTPAIIKNSDCSCVSVCDTKTVQMVSLEIFEEDHKKYDTAL